MYGVWRNGGNNMKFLLCYTVEYDNGGNIKVESEDFDDFAQAVVRYTLMCGGRDQVVLAETESCRIIKQFTRERADSATGTVPSVFIK